MPICSTHHDRTATGACRDCGHEYCPECLVYSYGNLQPPYCLNCALRASGLTPRVGDTTA